MFTNGQFQKNAGYIYSYIRVLELIPNENFSRNENFNRVYSTEAFIKLWSGSFRAP